MARLDLPWLLIMSWMVEVVLFDGSFFWVDKLLWEEKLWHDDGFCLVMLLLMANMMGSCCGRVAVDKASQRHEGRETKELQRGRHCDSVGR